MRGGEDAPVAGGAVEGGEVEGGRKRSLPMKLKRWNMAKRSVEKKLGHGLGVVRKGSKVYEQIKRAARM
jgi:hypothetical protein